MADQFEHHEHEELVHSHPHFHVTHNYNRLTGGFDHLFSEHEHDHDHPAIAHAHLAHQDFDAEHRGEAHVHDHGEAVKAGREPSEQAATKKAVGKRTSAKKAIKKSITP